MFGVFLHTKRGVRKNMVVIVDGISWVRGRKFELNTQKDLTYMESNHYEAHLPQIFLIHFNLYEPYVPYIGRA